MKKLIKKWRTQFTPYDAKKFGLVCEDPSLAVQADRDMFNPNNVMKLFIRTGDEKLFKRRQGIYADISDLGTMSSFADVRAAMEPINDLFMTLPALEREKYNHDPMAFLDFAKDPRNINYLIDLGLVERPNPVSQSSQIELGVPPNGTPDSSAT